MTRVELQSVSSIYFPWQRKLPVVQRVLNIGIFLLLSSCGRGQEQSIQTLEVPACYRLADYFRTDAGIDRIVDSVFNSLDDTLRIAQKLVVAAGRLGLPDARVDALVAAGRVGGVLLLNGTVDDFRLRVARYDSLTRKGGHVPQLYSADAEPSLINRKITGTRKVPKTANIRNADTCRNVALRIAGDLRAIGIRHNFAPVIDLGQSNEAIRDRSFSAFPDSVVHLAGIFSRVMQDEGIIATAKHFPGHGRVQGDTHKGLVYIRGYPEESGNYAQLIGNGILSVMVGHIAVQGDSVYDTGGLPAVCSPVIVNDLLRGKMEFKGLIVTDAMNMGALYGIQDAGLLAARAGCDIILMPPDERGLIGQMLAEMERDAGFRETVYQSVRRILRAKVCLNLLTHEGCN